MDDAFSARGASGPHKLRVLFDPPASGVWNMAVDEALLESAAASGEAILRFYTWERPTLSLGYFQAAGDRERHSPSLDCPLVRRSTGGGAILHDRELTYSLVVPNQATAAAARRLYEIVHRSLIAELAALGVTAALHGAEEKCSREASPQIEPFLCFQRRTCFDVVCEGAKIVGSAQRRRGKAVLQHGSILLAQSEAAPELPGILEAAGHLMEGRDLAERWVPRLARTLSRAVIASDLTGDERRLSYRLSEERFGASEFLYRRR